jgi:hypothetical protein
VLIARSKLFVSEQSAAAASHIEGVKFMLKKKISLAVLITGLVWLVCLTTLSQTSNAIQGSVEDKKQIAQDREAYMRYCASCHGIDAKGHGLVRPDPKRRAISQSSRTGDRAASVHESLRAQYRRAAGECDRRFP